MRYLLVDTCCTGHHLTYIMSIAQACAENGEAIILLPKMEDISMIENTKNLSYMMIRNGEYRGYFSLLKQIKSIVKNQKVDIVHFVYADEFMKYFGFGFASLGCKVILTFHQIRHSKLRTFSRKCMFRSVCCGVVHTDFILKRLNEDGIKNVKHIEYPYFQSVSQVGKKCAREKLGIDLELPVLLALGGTRYDKGIDLLLEALKQVKEPFFLLIAGEEQDIKISTIKELSAGYAKNVKMIMKFLSNEEFGLCLSASDLIVLPYRKCFDGASGPLGEGVAYDKVIVGANHGSVGHLIEENCLGYTFESENPNDMAAVISVALTKSYEKQAKYILYREKLKPKRFQADYMRLYKETMEKNKKEDR